MLRNARSLHSQASGQLYVAYATRSCPWLFLGYEVLPGAHLQQGPMTTEARSKGREPPQTGRCPARKRALQREKNKRTADVAEIAQHPGAPAKSLVFQTKLIAQGQQHIPSTRMPNPGGDLASCGVSFFQDPVQHGHDMFGGHRRHLR